MFETEIEAGAEYLDKVRPGWELKIDAATLNMNHSRQCVVGQTLGDFWYHLRADPNHSMYWAEEHGFMVLGSNISEQYSILTEEWIEFIKVRLNLGVAV